VVKTKSRPFLDLWANALGVLDAFRDWFAERLQDRRGA
jgi:hypothetical protein